MCILKKKEQETVSVSEVIFCIILSIFNVRIYIRRTSNFRSKSIMQKKMFQRYSLDQTLKLLVSNYKYMSLMAIEKKKIMSQLFCFNKCRVRTYKI